MSTTSIVIDKEVITKLRRMGITNISAEIRDHLQKLVETSNINVDGINLELLKMEQEKRVKQMNQLSAEMRYFETQIEKIRELQEKNKEAELLKQKKEAEKLSKCQNCGQILPEKVKRHRFPIGAICNACFLTSNKEAIQQWNAPKQQSMTETQ